jgi:2,3,4,5-tetrahydropyridine-2,6-dicarboxylate N-succinyltransferase
LAEKFGLIRSDFVTITLDDMDAISSSTDDVYLRLHLLSECVQRPNTINLTAMFDLLPNVAWTSAGPVLPADVDTLRGLIISEHHHLLIPAIDKIPRMVDYVVPPGVRIGDADRVRLGAHLWPRTTVMH